MTWKTCSIVYNSPLTSKKKPVKTDEMTDVSSLKSQYKAKIFELH